MKNQILILLISIILPIAGICKKPSEEKNAKPKFLHILKSEGIESYQIPTLLVKFAISFSEDSDEIMPLLKGSRSINISICDNHERNYSDCFKRICSNLDFSSYQDLVNIVDNNSRITVKALLNDKIIRELVILINDDDSFVALSLTGKINPHDIADSIAELNKQKNHNH